MALIAWFVALAGLGGVLFAYASRVRAPFVGAILLVFGTAVFVVRLGHEGSYPFPHGADLAFGTASLLAGLLLVRAPWGTRIAAGGTPLGTRALLALTPIILFGALIAILHEVEEVVVLRTFDGAGDVLDTRLWVVDVEGAPWVVTGPRTEHVARLAAHPRVELLRRGTTTCYVARPFGDPKTIEAVLAQRLEKYRVYRVGLAAGFWRPPSGRIEDMAVAIRLDPCPPGES